MKKALSMILIGVMTISLAACGKSSQPAADSQTDSRTDTNVESSERGGKMKNR